MAGAMATVRRYVESLSVYEKLILAAFLVVYAAEILYVATMPR